MNRIIADYSNGVERLLYLNRQPFPHEAGDISVDVLARLPEYSAALLHGQPQERYRAARREEKNLASFVRVCADFI